MAYSLNQFFKSVNFLIQNHTIKNNFNLIKTVSSRRWIHKNNNQSEVQEKVETINSNLKFEELLDTPSSSHNSADPNIDTNWATTPYPQGSRVRDQSAYSFRPNVDPGETSVILFPGQGTQYVGMGKNLLKFPIVKDLFECANEILGYNLIKLCLNGPKEQLDKTLYSQPAVFVCSLAALERLKEERPAAVDKCVATAGFSIGEITALTFAGALSFQQALWLVNVRAEAMQIASDMAPGGMMTVLLHPNSQLSSAVQKSKEWCMEKGIENPECRIANYLYPHCKVISGHIEALKYIESHQGEYNLKRVKRLPVSGAFHSDLMQPAAEPFKLALKKVQVTDPLICVHSNVDGKRYRDASHIIRQLPKQIYKPVKWEQIMHIVYERPVDQSFPRTFECGPGRSLKTVLKQVNAKASDMCMNIET